MTSYAIINLRFLSECLYIHNNYQFVVQEGVIMDLNGRLSVSYYKTIASIDTQHGIYIAKHSETNKIFIKKILSVYNKDIYMQLLSNHVPGTPKIYAVNENNNNLTVIEEYISGDTLQDKIESGEIISNEIIISYLIQLCDILHNLHNLKKPVIHRDIKPSNVIITPDNHVKLIDFNAAKYVNETQNKDTILLGTEGYAAPEQYGFGASNCQTDIYAVGVLMNELFQSSNNNKYIVPDVTKIVQRCTQMNPNDRYASVTELKNELINLQNPNKEANMSDMKNNRTSFIIPGFRKKVPWHMFIAIFGYIFIFWLSLTINIENVTHAVLWYERVFLLIMMLSVVFVSCNYLNIQNLFPAWIHKNKFIYVAGIIIINIIILAFLMIIMLISESIFW